MVGGLFYKIRSDFRAVLDAITIFDDPELDIRDKWYVCLHIIYEDFDEIPQEHIEEAIEQACIFINAGAVDEGDRSKPVLMNWTQDAPIIVPAVNRVLGKEIRAEQYLHWWTFVGAYMEINESLFTNVLDIRAKRASGKKLNESEKEFLRKNKSLVILKKQLTDEEAEEEKQRQDDIKALLGV